MRQETKIKHQKIVKWWNKELKQAIIKYYDSVEIGVEVGEIFKFRQASFI